MEQKLLTRLGWWMCDKVDHPFPRHAWIYDGAYHRDCRWCGRIISIRHSEPLEQEQEQ